MINWKDAVTYLVEKHQSYKPKCYLINESTAAYFADKDFINFIIPARGRVEFAKPLYESFINATIQFKHQVLFTFVEHSEEKQHSDYFADKDVNYIHIEAGPGEQFNKCLCYNIGVKSSPKTKYVLCHDLDILIKPDFFNNIMANIERKQYQAMQCYTGRRVLNLDKELTDKILTEGLTDSNYKNLEVSSSGVGMPMYLGKPALGSKGGSIIVKSELFNKVGGFDDGLFRAYSAEDAFFWDKISCFTDIGYADEPAIELLHMYHPPQIGSNPFYQEMQRDYDLFKTMPKEFKLAYIKNITDAKEKVTR